MDLNKLGTIIKMGCDKKVLKCLLNIYNILKEDKNFTITKYIRLMSNMMKGEKIIKYEDKYIISTFLPPFPSKAFISNIMAVDSPENIFTKQMNAKRSAPISMYLCLTHKCPNNCIYCSSKKRSGDRELTTEQWVNTIKDIQDMNTSIIGLTGGDPMIRKDIFHIIKAIDHRSASILFTSGYNLTFEKAKELKENGLFGIGISLDSYDKEEHNKNRRSDKAFDYALEAMRVSRKAGLYTMAQTVILKKDIDEKKLFKLFQLAKDNGAHEVKILEPILSGNLLYEKNLENILYDNEARKRLIEIQHRANKIKGFPKITTFAYTESKEKFGCGAGTQHSYISASGELYPCDFVPMNFGNVTDTSIKILWKEMNKIIGKPKIGCFAQRVNRQVVKEAEGILPLNKKASTIICKGNQSKEMADYYKSFQ